MQFKPEGVDDDFDNKAVTSDHITAAKAFSKKKLSLSPRAASLLAAATATVTTSAQPPDQLEND